MPNTRNAKKALRKSLKRYEENRRFKMRLKRWIKKYITQVNEAKKEHAQKTLIMVQKLLDKAGKKHIYHKNKVNRLKSRFFSMLNKVKVDKTAK